MEYTKDMIAEMRASISLEGVYAARKVIEDFLNPTPLLEHPLLNEALGFPIHVKHENHLPTGAFKIRGGYNYMAQLSDEERAIGVITATRGNHGQSIALAARDFGVRAVIVVPHGNNPEKNAAIRAFGAELVEYGKDYDEAREYCGELMKKEGLRYIHSGNEPDLIHGVGTYNLEILELLPEIDTIILPIGGGSSVCGAITVYRALKPEVRIIGVQAANAPCVYESWKAGRVVTTGSADTFADGLATRVPMELPLSIISDGIDEIITVTEEEIRRAAKLIITTTHNLAEGAGAASIAGAYAIREQLAGKTVVAVLSGGNLDQDTLRWVLEAQD